jgi:hypothetical protein
MVAEYWGGTEVMLTSTRRIEKRHPRRSDLGPTLLGVEGASSAKWGRVASAAIWGRVASAKPPAILEPNILRSTVGGFKGSLVMILFLNALPRRFIYFSLGGNA